MADERESLRLEVDSSGVDSGVQGFLSGIGRIPEVVEDVLNKLEGNLDPRLLDSYGEKIAANFSRALHGAIAGVKVDGKAITLDNIGELAMRASGLDPESTKRFADQAQSLRRLAQEYANNFETLRARYNIQAPGSVAGMLGMPDERSISRSTEALQRYAALQEVVHRQRQQAIQQERALSVFVAHRDQLDRRYAGRRVDRLAAALGTPREQDAFGRSVFDTSLRDLGSTTGDALGPWARRQDYQRFWESPEAQAMIDANERALNEAARARVLSNNQIIRSEEQLAAAQQRRLERQEAARAGYMGERFATPEARERYVRDVWGAVTDTTPPRTREEMLARVLKNIAGGPAAPGESSPYLADKLAEQQRRAAWETPEAQAALDRAQQEYNASIRKRVLSNNEVIKSEADLARAQGQLTRGQQQRMAATRISSPYQLEFFGDARRSSERMWDWQERARIEQNRRLAMAAFGGDDGRGGPPGPWDNFMRGWRGGGDQGRSWAEMAGQTARISLAYGVAYRMLFLLQDALVNITQATLEYGSALTDLEIATGRSASQNQELARSLADTAASAGFRGAQGVEMGWRSLGLYGVAHAPQEEQERTARLSAEVATRVARVSGADPVQVQTQLAGALRSFQYGVDRLPQLEDMITYISRTTGQSTTELLGATANIATLGRSAGFTPEQLMAIVAQVGTTTGQNPEATAGQFRQVLSREFATVAANAQAVFGLDTSGMSTVADVFAAVSRLDASQQQINQFTSGFGKGGSQSVAMITLENWDRIQDLAEGATSSPGIGQDAFNRAMLNFGRQIQTLGTTFMDFGVQLADTGMFDWLALIVGGAQNVVSAGGDLLDLFNQLPRPLRSAALALGELYIASRVLSRMDIGGVVGRMARGLQDIFSGRMTVAAAGAGIAGALRHSEESRAAARALAADPTAGTRGQRAWMAAQARTGMTGLGIGLTIAGVAAIGAGIGDGIARTLAARESVREVRGQIGAASTVAELANAAAAAQNAVREITDSGLRGLEPGNVYELLPRLIATMTTGADADRLRGLAEDTQQRVEALERAQAELVAQDSSRVFTDFSAEGLQNTLAELETQGYSAADRLDLLARALTRVGEDATVASTAVASIRPNEVGAVALQIGAAASSAVMAASSSASVIADSEYYARTQGYSLFVPLTDPGGFLSSRTWKDAANVLEDASPIVAEAVRERAESLLSEFASDGAITEAEFQAVMDAVMQEFEANLDPGAWKRLVDEGHRAVIEHILRNGVQDAMDAYNGTITSTNVGDIARFLPEAAAMRGAETTQRTGSRELGLREEGRWLREMRSVVVGLLPTAADTEGAVRGLAAMDAAIDAVRREMIQVRMDRIRSIAQYHQSLLPDEDVQGRLAIEIQAIRDQILQMDAGGLTGSSMTPEEAERMRQLQTELVRKEREAAENARLTTAAFAVAAVAAGDTMGMAAVEVSNAEMALGALEEGTLAYAQALLALNQAKRSLATLEVQAANNAALAAVDSRDTVGRARVAVQNAAREMNHAGAGSPEYYAALEAYRAALVQQTMAAVQLANARANAGIAGLVSQLRQARTEVANAERLLGAQLEGTQGYYDALANLERAKLALAQAERAQADRRRRLRSDLTDPVEQARLDVEAAKAELEAARERGDGRDVIDQLKLDLRNAENAEEDAAFRQRIRDLQTAEDLGRITHTAYMAYLKAEHDRLSAIKNRTRQQQEHLDEVERLMKAAAEQLQGQWNIGDIRLPTIYEVRRSMQSDMGNSVTDYSHSNNTVYINGADYAAVIAWLEEHLGTSAQMVFGYEDRRA